MVVEVMGRMKEGVATFFITMRPVLRPRAQNLLDSRLTAYLPCSQVTGIARFMGGVFFLSTV